MTWHLPSCSQLPEPSQLPETLWAWSLEHPQDLCITICHFFGWSFGPDLSFSCQKEIKAFQALDVIRAEMNWPLYITYVIYQNSSCTLLLIKCLETFSSLAMALIDFLGFLSIIFWNFHINVGVLMVLRHLGSILHLPTAVESSLAASSSAKFHNKWPCNFQEVNNLYIIIQYI